MQNSQEQAAQDYANDERAKAMEEASEQMAGEMNNRNWEDQWRQEGKGQDDGREFPPEEKTPEQQEQEQKEQENKENQDEDSNPNSTTYPTANQPQQDDSIETTNGGGQRQIGWNNVKNELVTGMKFMMHDGDQQWFNPYGHVSGNWTMYSFRPEDARKSWPQIAITPASFEAIKSMDDMLNLVPYIVVKEYFFKNTAATMVDFIKKIADSVKTAFQPAKQDDNGGDATVNDKTSQGSAAAKKEGNSMLDKIKEIFQTADTKIAQKTVIDIPYVLYAGLRQRQYGNTYIFPYIATSSTVINEASNTAEWEKGQGGLIEGLKTMLSNIAGMAAGLAAGAIGSTAKGADLFPAPTWGGPKGEGVSFQFDLMLINDNIVKSRNNYMCVNTIIHNNRSIQKAILAFPGALYEIWLPTGQRHLMCTGDFKLYPLGLNRRTPNNFFKGGGVSGAKFEIGTSYEPVATIKNPHQEGIEVIPDAYKLSITFKSCLPNNMNTAVFQYYVKMVGYSDGIQPGAQEDGAISTEAILTGEVQQKFKAAEVYKEDMPEENTNSQQQQATTNGVTRGSQSEIVDSDELNRFIETFEESTYNKTIGKLNTNQGEQSTTSQGVVEIVKKSQATIGDSQRFLDKLYNSSDSALWYRPDPNEELQTTFKPDYRKQLQDRYKTKIQELRRVDAQLRQVQSDVREMDNQLQKTSDLESRDELLRKRVLLMKTISAISQNREQVADELVQIDTDMI